ncbi:hypothetical protein NW768_010904 [Fusarium equiseti]|uniref:Uncharacterized protein n=1 Tax=Fusarium equiseti TaxID=61235 RepID=A0ABQ8QYZ9_FUSEQ|nr:hypothetical protein NW768_010904 [Fusarium equiseti]
MKKREKVALKESKRVAWLDMLYLRNQLLSWSSCLESLDKQARQLNRRFSRRPISHPSYCYEGTDGFGSGYDSSSECSLNSPEIWSVDNAQDHMAGQLFSRQLIVAEIDPYSSEDCKTPKPSEFYIRRTGTKIRGRLQKLKKDYNDKIQECTHGIEGVVLSIQWAQGETNVEIALATSQDSRHMRSIALVTMVFLPGTFFASVFSMGFFDFKGSRGSVIVSQLFWLDRLEAVLTEQRIIEALGTEGECPPERQGHIAQEIINPQGFDADTQPHLHSRKEILAILSLIDKVSTIGSFIKDSLYDYGLPFRYVKRPDSPNGYVVRTCDISKEPRDISLFYQWSTTEIESFEGRQWIIHVPLFTSIQEKTEKPTHYAFAQKAIAPYIS